MKNLFFFLLLATLGLATSCEPSDGRTYAMIETDMGNMKVWLYDSTPLHKENFIKLAKESYYDSLLFHRVIEGFMIQGGDPQSKYATPTQGLGAGGPGYTVPAEIGALHVKGALSAARQGDAVNPQKASSGSQFYVVQGRPQTEAQLGAIGRSKGITYSPEQMELYKTLGGTPQLDQDYTVFGEVVEGMEVIDKIAAVKTRPGDRPEQDVRMKVYLLD